MYGYVPCAQSSALASHTMVDYWHLLLYAHMKIINIRWQVTFEQRICILIKYLKSPINHTKTVRTAKRSSSNNNNNNNRTTKNKKSPAKSIKALEYIRKSLGNCWPISNNKHTYTHAYSNNGRRIVVTKIDIVQKGTVCEAGGKGRLVCLL